MMIGAAFCAATVFQAKTQPESESVRRRSFCKGQCSMEFGNGFVSLRRNSKGSRRNSKGSELFLWEFKGVRTISLRNSKGSELGIQRGQEFKEEFKGVKEFKGVRTISLSEFAGQSDAPASMMMGAAFRATVVLAKAQPKRESGNSKGSELFL